MEGGSSIPVDPSVASTAMDPRDLFRDWDSTYRWITIAGGFFSFLLALVAGANDIPTAFGVSIGAGVISLRQSLIIAFVMEILGATLLGRRTIDAIESCQFKEIPTEDLMMWGLLIAVIAATIWLMIMTYFEIPVTSSLSIQGAIIGIVLTTQGWDSVYWSKKDSRSLLHLGGVISIILSWTMAPLISLVGAICFFGTIKFMLLRPQEAEKRALRALPFLYGLTAFVIVLFIIYRCAPGTNLSSMTFVKASIISSASAALTTFLAYLIVLPLARKRFSVFGVHPSNAPVDIIDRAEKQDPEEANEVSADEVLKQFNELRVLHTVYECEEEESGSESPASVVKCSPVCGGPSNIPLKQLLTTPNHSSFRKLQQQPKHLSLCQYVITVFDKLRTSTFDHEIEYNLNTRMQHEIAEKHDTKIEYLFSFLLILSGSVITLAHGSNDVAFIMGPYGGILNIFKRHSLKSSTTDGSLFPWHLNVWVRVLGGVGVCVGYGVWGWKVVRYLGYRLVYLTPSRSFSVQLCTLVTVLLAMLLRLPISTTHILIGAILGISIVDNIKNVNWWLMATLVVMWVLTFVSTCGVTAALYAFTIFSPSVTVVQ